MLERTWQNIKDEPVIIDDVMTAVIVSLGGVRSGKSQDPTLHLMGKSKYLFIGKYKVEANTFHREIKPDILSKAGNFSKSVGKNPDINVNKADQIILTGNGPFKGKTYNTSLNGADFLK